jgi:hypothetical protein
MAAPLETPDTEIELGSIRYGPALHHTRNPLHQPTLLFISLLLYNI